MEHTYQDPRFLSWNTKEDPRGILTVCEFPVSLPFLPVRVYWIHGIPDGSVRGGHAHREVDEILIPVQGGFSVTLLSLQNS